MLGKGYNPLKEHVEKGLDGKLSDKSEMLIL